MAQAVAHLSARKGPESNLQYGKEKKKKLRQNIILT
jgi:hypothetical protein